MEQTTVCIILKADLPYNGHGKNKETKGMAMKCILLYGKNFFVWQFIVHSMICISDQPE